MNKQGRNHLLPEKQREEDIYQRIINSQGNLSSAEVTSSRYTATSGIRNSDPSDAGPGVAASDRYGDTTTIRSGSGSGTVSPGSVSGDPRYDRMTAEDRSAPGSSAANNTGSNSTKTTDTSEDASVIKGPTVEEVTIFEHFHEDFGVYEEAMNNSQFFYATIGNGGMTDGSVAIEFPANMEYVLEKDGVEIPYASGQTLGERGSYVLRITVIEDTSLPFSEQKIYRAMFRFRIQERLAAAASPEDSWDGKSVMPFGFEGWDSGGNMGTGILPEETTAAKQEETTAAAQEETERGGLMNDDGSMDDDALEAALLEAMGGGYGTEGLEGYNPATGLASAYDAQAGYYRHELASGETFFTDIPNGMITNYPVMILTNDDLPFRVLKDGEPIEYVPGTTIDEYGSYTVYPYSESSIYLASYSGKTEPSFRFRIIEDRVNDIGFFHAPEQGRIVSVRYTKTGSKPGETEEYMVSDDWFYLREDGRYEIDVEMEGGQTTVSFERDTRAPRFHYINGKGQVSIEYVTPDVDSCRISKDGDEIYNGNPATVIDDPGNYSFTVYDRAGNSSSADIEIAYRMNTAAVLAMVMVALLAAILFLFTKRTRKQAKVV